MKPVFNGKLLQSRASKIEVPIWNGTCLQRKKFRPLRFVHKQYLFGTYFIYYLWNQSAYVSPLCFVLFFISEALKGIRSIRKSIAAVFQAPWRINGTIVDQLTIFDVVSSL